MLHFISNILPLFLIFLLTGAIMGLNAGFIGGGGGIYAVPILIYTFTLLGYSEENVGHLAVGTSLAVISTAALSSSIVHIKKGVIYRNVIVAMTAFGAVGAWIGGSVSVSIDVALFKRIFAVVMIIVGLRFYFGDKGTKGTIAGSENGTDGKPREISLRILVISGISGFLAGFFSSFFGIGGGIVMLPATLFLLRFCAVEAIAHSSCTTMINALFGALVHIYHGLGVEGLPPFSLGYVNYAAAVSMIISGTLASRWAAKRIHKVDHAKLFKIITVVIIVAAVVMLIGV
ncbi:MAG: sulfite exporter TauE/SafE family protein [Deltaproteobacteria bacterium]|uniref:Probable membrane transporter protein n=1 Tax=Candidatus Zymogenus saltonus TaxID=2844893 RepID=A0A9D8KCT7_9DELT|nr:sulfite exporter TauE/SafE family protein [Candidatus Zymogenus saltonus]